MSWLQIIKYKWIGLEPHLIIRNQSSVVKLPLLNQTIKFKINKRLCIGYWKNGKHYQCPTSSFMLYEYLCNSCRGEDDFSNCTKCDGTTCINKKQREQCKQADYIVYLAMYNSMIKVGISLKIRMLERFVEQGADLVAKIIEIQDGKKARNIERFIKSYLNIPDRIYGKDKNNNIFPDFKQIKPILEQAIENLKISPYWYLLSPEIYTLTNYYHLDCVKKKPRPMNVFTNMRLEGKVIAAKGNILILRNNNEYFSLNAHRLIGRCIEPL